MVPNIITSIRVLLLFPILACIAKGTHNAVGFRAAAGLFLLAILTDMLDGQAARRLKQVSVLGGMYDLAADRLLMTPTLFMIYISGLFTDVKFIGSLTPKAYVALIIIADITVIIGILMYLRLRSIDPSAQFPTPTVAAKAAYPVQGFVVFFALLRVNPQIVTTFMLISSMMTIIAFVSYMKKGNYVFKGAMPGLFKAVADAAVKEFTEDAPGSGKEEKKPEDGKG